VNEQNRQMTNLAESPAEPTKAFFHVSPFKLMVEAETGAFYLENPQNTDHHEVS
jgi:hypothetical protein